MQKEYIVNEKKQKELLAKMRKKQSGKCLGLKVFRLILIAACIGILFVGLITFVPPLIDVIEAGYFADIMAGVAAVGLTIIVTVLLLLIPMVVKHLIQKKSLYPWMAYSGEHLYLHRNSMEWEFYDKFQGKDYWSFQMKYSDIIRMEYDKGQHLLRVYGTRSGKVWNSINKEKCYDSFVTDKTVADKRWFTLCEYYDNFPQLIKDLEAVTGQTIIECNQPMKF